MNIRRFLKYMCVSLAVGASLTYIGRSVSHDWLIIKGGNQTDTGSNIAAKDIAPNEGKSNIKASLKSATLRINKNGEDAESRSEYIQKQLVKCGYLPATQVDGIIGKTTTHAIISFQSSTGINADGKFGPVTESKTSSCKSDDPRS